ncbi:MAG: 8-oxo-dGTP diphosphatase MutT [Alphaproteobacteria bacterium]|nr:8-oxo-dGTP diphosphatase MutT [Alphaproteobacteria bacterium]
MTEKLRLVLVAAAALVDGSGRILMAERPAGKELAGLWEFPGGKVEDGERPEDALVRELREELGIEVAPAALEPFAFASHGYERFHLLMPLYVCRAWEGEVKAMEGQRIAWTHIADLPALAVPPADGPLIVALMKGARAS